MKYKLKKIKIKIMECNLVRENGMCTGKSNKQKSRDTQRTKTTDNIQINKISIKFSILFLIK